MKKIKILSRKDKQDLLIALCGYLPYKIVIEESCYCNKEWLSKYPTDKELNTLTSIDLEENIFTTSGGSQYHLENIRVYLRPTSSITQDEQREYGKVIETLKWTEEADWLNEHHFDYRGLIEKGLALEAPEGMYS